MILLKIKSSKREVSAMMSAYSKWQQDKLNIGPAGEGVRLNASESPSSETGAPRASTSSPSASADFTAEPINSAIQFVKSRLLDLRSNQDKAEADLKSASVVSISAAPFYNSMGVLAFHKRKFAVSSLYFLKASQENQKLRQSTWSQVLSDSRKKLPESVPDISTDVTYNMGLQMLLLGQFESAMRCFQEVLDRITTGSSSSCSPALVHLRLSEAQLAVYSARMSEQVDCSIGAGARASNSPDLNLSSFNSHTSGSLASSTSSGSSSYHTANTSTHTTQSSTSGDKTLIASSSSSVEPSAPSSDSSVAGKDTSNQVSKTASDILREGGWLKMPRLCGVEQDPLLDSALQNASTAYLLFERFGKSGVSPPTSFGSRGATGINAIVSAVAAQNHTAHFALIDRSQLTPRDFLLRLYTQVLLAWMCLENDNLTKALEWTAGARQSHSELESLHPGVHSSSSSVGDGGTSFTASEKAEFDHYFFLAHLYQAEAELRLGNITGALTALETAPALLAKYPLLPALHSPYTSVVDPNPAISSATGGSKSSGPTSSPSPSHSIPTTGTSAVSIVPPKVALLCNMAAVWIVKKDLAQAQKLVSQALTQVPHLLPAVALQVYLELAAGNTEVAVRLMCEYRVHDLLLVR